MRKFIFLALIACLASCGVKNDLTKPNGQSTPKTERDPSLPPAPTTGAP